MNKKTDGILFLREFITNDLKLNIRFDFIFTFGVYEQIEFQTEELKNTKWLFERIVNVQSGIYHNA